MSTPLVLARAAESFVLAPQPANDTAKPRRPRKPSKARAATPAVRALEERRFELRDTPRGVALVEVSGEPARGYVVQVVTAQTVTVRETVRESFVCDEEGEWSIVEHAPRAEVSVRTVYGTVEVPCAKVGEVEAACWRAMHRPHGVGTIGDLALPIARGDEGAVEPVTIRVLVREHAELDIGRPREAVRLVKREGRWEVEGGDALLGALARARASFDAARAARITPAPVEAPASEPAATPEVSEVAPDAAPGSGEFPVATAEVVAPVGVVVEAVAVSGRSLGSDAAPLAGTARSLKGDLAPTASVPLVGTGSARKARSASASPPSKAPRRSGRRSPGASGGENGGAL